MRREVEHTELTTTVSSIRLCPLRLLYQAGVIQSRSAAVPGRSKAAAAKADEFRQRAGAPFGELTRNRWRFQRIPAFSRSVVAAPEDERTPSASFRLNSTVGEYQTVAESRQGVHRIVTFSPSGGHLCLPEFSRYPTALTGSCLDRGPLLSKNMKKTNPIRNMNLKRFITQMGAAMLLCSASADAATVTVTNDVSNV
jgi:hypothetical protein